VIAIVNVSKKAKPTGIHRYELRINRDVICKFTHRREESLSKCLRRAAEAYDREMIKLFDRLNKEECDVC
jgi:hypothetical protein